MNPYSYMYVVLYQVHFLDAESEEGTKSDSEVSLTRRVEILESEIRMLKGIGAFENSWGVDGDGSSTDSSEIQLLNLDSLLLILLLVVILCVCLW